jgi:hypothetical protein
VSTGVLVIYVDDESFSFMTPEGHIFAGMITFSAYTEEGGAVCAQIQALIRANDPLYELGARVGIVHSMEDEHWHTVLTNLAAHFNVQDKVLQVNVWSTQVCSGRSSPMYATMLQSIPVSTWHLHPFAGLGDCSGANKPDQRLYLTYAKSRVL